MDIKGVCALRVPVSLLYNSPSTLQAPAVVGVRKLGNVHYHLPITLLLDPSIGILEVPKLNLANLQELLPSGLRVASLLKDDCVFGHVYRLFDERVATNAPFERRLRVFEVDKDTAWRDPLIKCVQGFCHLRSTRFATALEFGVLNGGAIYLIEELFPADADEQLPTDGKGYSPQLAWPWIEQLLEGLAERHAVGLPQGTWRLSSLQFNTQAVDDNTKMVLGDAVGSRVPWLSKGDHFTNELREYFPPEWNGKLQAPSSAADVYAIGVLACELLLGRAAVQRVRQQAAQSANGPTRLRELMINETKGIRLSGRARQLLAKMLEPDPQQRPQHARAVLETPKVSVSWACCMLTVIALILSVVLLRSKSTLLTAENADLRQQLAGESQDNKTLKTEWEKAKEDLSLKNAELRGLNEKLMASIDREEDSKKKLREKDETIETQRKAIERLSKGEPPPILPPLTTPNTAQNRWVAFAKNKSSTEILAAVEKENGKPEELQLLRTWAEDVAQAWGGINHSFTEDQKKPGAAKTGRERAYYAFRDAPWRDDLKETIVRNYWGDFLPTKSHLSTSDVSDLFDIIEKAPPRTWLRERLNTLAKPIRDKEKSLQRWLEIRQPHKLVAPIQKWLKQPWDDSAKNTATQQLESLKEAAKIWEQFAAEPNDSWNDFKAKAVLKAEVEGTDVCDIVKTWIAEFESRSDWEIQLGEAKAPTGYGVYRIVQMRVDSTSSITLDERDWSTETKADYSPFTPAKFNWKPGQSIRIAMEGERSLKRGYFRPEIFAQEFKGPLAVWQLAKSREIKVGDDRLLQVEIIPSPGPPKLP